MSFFEKILSIALFIANVCKAIFKGLRYIHRHWPKWPDFDKPYADTKSRKKDYQEAKTIEV